MPAKTEKNVQIRLESRPEGLPGAQNFRRTEEPIPEPGEGEVLVRNVYLSLDPAMRGWMREGKSYVPPVELGAVMRGITVGEVVKSNDSGFEPGDHVQGLLGWQLYATAKAGDLTKLPKQIPLRVALGPLGMTGLTAYFGLLDVGEPKEGDTVLISGAAGAVGSVAAQIAKIRGCRVVGIAGSDEKCRWLTEKLGLDGTINYKTTEDLGQAVKEACPKGVDVYFDNVGGEILDAALARLARGARVVICGAISQYNSPDVEGPSNYLSLLINRARMEGFVVFDYEPRYGEALRELGGWLEAGQLHYREDVVEGLENAPEALKRLFDGSNEGKLMVRLGPES